MIKFRLLLFKLFLFLLMLLFLIIFIGCEKREEDNNSFKNEKVEQSYLLNSDDLNQQETIKKVDIPEELSSLLSKGYVVYAVLERQGNTTIFLAKTTNTMKLAFGDFILLILSKNCEVVAYKELYSNSTYHPIYYDASNLAVGFFNNEVFKAEIYIFNENEGIIKSVVAEDRYVAEVFLYNDQLYYSTEKSDYAIKRIDLTDNEFFYYKYPYLANALFIADEGKVYAIFENRMYEITDNELKKTDIVKPQFYHEYSFRDSMNGDFFEYNVLLGLK